MDTASRLARARAQGFNTEARFYHVTRAPDFSAFDAGYSGASNTVGGGERAIFLTNNPRIARSYMGSQWVRKYREGWSSERYKKAEATLNRLWDRQRDLRQFSAAKKIPDQWRRMEAMNKLVAVFETGMSKTWTPEQVAPGARTIPVFARTDKIKTIDMRGAQYDPERIERELRKAKKAGKSGVAFMNLMDWGGDMSVRPEAGLTLAIFDPKDIRSVNAAFDPAQDGSAELLALTRDRMPKGPLGRANQRLLSAVMRRAAAMGSTRPSPISTAKVSRQLRR